MNPLKEPSLQLTEVKIENFGITSAKVAFIVEVDNPNDRDLEVESLDYQLILNSKNFKPMALKDIPKIKKTAKTSVQIPLEFEYQDLFKSIEEALTQRKIKYKIIGEAKVSGFKLPIAKESEITF